MPCWTHSRSTSRSAGRVSYRFSIAGLPRAIHHIAVEVLRPGCWTNSSRHASMNSRPCSASSALPRCSWRAILKIVLGMTSSVERRGSMDGPVGPFDASMFVKRSWWCWVFGRAPGRCSAWGTAGSRVGSCPRRCGGRCRRGFGCSCVSGWARSCGWRGWGGAGWFCRCWPGSDWCRSVPRTRPRYGICPGGRS